MNAPNRGRHFWAVGSLVAVGVCFFALRESLAPLDGEPIGQREDVPKPRSPDFGSPNFTAARVTPGDDIRSASSKKKLASEGSSSHSSTSEQRREPPMPKPSELSAHIELSTATAAEWRQTVFADCHGEIVKDCDKLISTFTRVLQAPDNTDDGWSEWMEDQIRLSLAKKARDYMATGTDVKCSAEGCVFILYADSASKMFAQGWQHKNDFDDWLRLQPWNDWLELKTKQGGAQSTLAWRVVGLIDAKPLINWYVVTRRP